MLFVVVVVVVVVVVWRSSSCLSADLWSLTRLRMRRYSFYLAPKIDDEEAGEDGDAAAAAPRRGVKSEDGVKPEDDD